MANASGNTAQDVVAAKPMASPDDLRAISSIDDAIALVQAQLGATVYDATEAIGDGFTMLDDKDRLLSIPFFAVSWTFAPGDFGAEYLIMRVVTDRGEKYVVTDGGTGLCDQVRSFTERTGSTNGLLVRRGLRKSEYDNEFGHGVTYYLNV